MKFLIIALLSLLLLFCVGEGSKSKAAQKLLSQQKQKEKITVFEKDLIQTEKLTSRSILKGSQEFSESLQGLIAQQTSSDSTSIIPSKLPRRHTGKTLGYITPWNAKGYEHAKTFAYKFDYLSPCWFHFNKGETVVRGDHNVDRGWMEDVKTAYPSYPSPAIIPRFSFDGWGAQDLDDLFKTTSKRDKLIENILIQATQHKFDGIVVDVGYIPYSQFGDSLVEFISSLSTQIHQLDLLLVWVIPPMTALEEEEKELLTAADMETINSYIDAFSIMTYDFSSHHGRVGPTAPVDWMMRSILRLIPPSKRTDKSFTDKFLLGLNFYGREYKPSVGEVRALTGTDYVKVLETQKAVKFVWEESFHEHLIYYSPSSTSSPPPSSSSSSSSAIIIYPTLKYLQTRIEIARTAGIGISIWEIGQGLDYFFDLL
eukprot:TRINITY_DN6127_c0_g1_i1.p1 TRINITY_DN6127_c0_g1~~TRINITY_DN6127_c0_g1_i1.p1  ORF type:complete len:427 (-),score=98.36 TRINITY_DN6127_c0_g1_i1:157-1437(-)